MFIIRARACIRCKEYVPIHPDNPLNQNMINVFEKKHHQHTLITVYIDEIRDEYQVYKNNENVNHSSEQRDSRISA